MPDQNWLQGVMDWYQTNVAPVMNTVRDYMETIDPEGAQQARTLSGMSRGEMPVPTIDDLAGAEQTPVSAGTTALPPFSQKALPPASPMGAGPSEAGGTSAWPGSYTKGASGGGNIPVEEMVSPGGKRKLLGKLLGYGIPAAMTAGPLVSSMFGGNAKATDEAVNPNLVRLVDPSIPDRATEEKAARQEIEAATSALKEPKEEPFDIEAIARKYGNPQGGGYVGQDTGSVFTSKEIAKEDLGGLKKTGYVEKDGKKVYIYSKPEKKTETAGAGTPGGDDNASKITAFENSVIKKMGWDPRTFNPAEEARKAMEAEKDRYFNWTFGGNAHPNYLTPEQAKHWKANLDALYQQKLGEFTTRQAQGEKMLSTLVSRFEKEHIKQPLHVKEGERVLGYNKTTGKYEDLVAGGPKAGKPLSTEQANQLDKVLNGAYMDQTDERKMTMTGGKVYESLPKGPRDEYDAIREKASRIMIDSIRSGNPVTAHEAVKMARKETGTETAQPPAGYRDTGKTINGKKAYVSPDGKKVWTS
jgi:hypothetical protein